MRSLGWKRNALCSMARGQVILHWDDDDTYSPGRVEDQLRRLLQCGRAVTGYSDMRFTDGISWWIYTAPKHYVMGNSMCYWREWWTEHRFPNAQVGEDVTFAETAWRAGQLDSTPSRELAYALVHPGNTDPKRRARLNSGGRFRRLSA